jgi:uncharacterized protein (TIGR02268 family)
MVSLLITLFTAVTEPAETPPLPDCGPLILRAELRPESFWRGGPVCVSAAVATTFLFDTPLKLDRVVILGKERFGEVLLGERGVTLVPVSGVEPGERFRLTVEFVDERAPSKMEINLVVHPVRATRQVQVYRHARPLEELLAEAQARVQSLEQEVTRLEAEVTRLKAVTGAPSELGDLLTSRFFRPEHGLAAQEISSQITLGERSPLLVEKAWSLHAGAQTAIWLKLFNPGAQAWVGTGGILVGPDGEVEVKLWQAEAIAPGFEQPVVIVPLAPGVRAGIGYELKLWDASGKRVVALGQISFP